MKKQTERTKISALRLAAGLLLTAAVLLGSTACGEEAKAEIIRLHSQALAHVQTLDLAPEAVATLENYAKNLIGRTK